MDPPWRFTLAAWRQLAAGSGWINLNAQTQGLRDGSIAIRADGGHVYFTSATVGGSVRVRAQVPASAVAGPLTRALDEAVAAGCRFAAAGPAPDLDPRLYEPY